MPKGLKVCIIGAESWGSAISTAVCKNVLNGEFDSRVHIYVYDELVKSNYLSELINEQHENIKYLPGIRLPKNLIAVNDLLEAAKDADILIFATPQSFIKPYCNILAGNVKNNAYAVSLVKGLDNIKDGVIDLYSHTIAKQLKIPCYSMMNANSAMEMAQGKLCEITIGCNHDAHAKQLTKLFQTDNCMVFSIDDVDGVELCNTLKDLVALSAGFIDGLRLGENTRVACLHLGLKEMMRFIKNFNPTTKMSTFFESCGIANSVASSFADKNVTLANNFVTSKKTIQEIEVNLLNGRKLLGPIIAEKMYAYLEENALLEMYPLFSVIHRICQKEVPPHAIVETLRNHPDMRNYSISQMQKKKYLLPKTSNADVVSENVADTIPEYMAGSADQFVSGLDDQGGFWKPYNTYFNIPNKSREPNQLSTTSENVNYGGHMQFTVNMESKNDAANQINQNEMSFDKTSIENNHKEQSRIDKPNNLSIPSERYAKPTNFTFKALRVTVKTKEQKAKETKPTLTEKTVEENKKQQSTEINKTELKSKTESVKNRQDNVPSKATKIPEVQQNESTAKPPLRKDDDGSVKEQILYEEDPSFRMRLFEDEPNVFKFLELMRKEESEVMENDVLKNNAPRVKSTERLASISAENNPVEEVLNSRAGLKARDNWQNRNFVNCGSKQNEGDQNMMTGKIEIQETFSNQDATWGASEEPILTLRLKDEPSSSYESSKSLQLREKSTIFSVLDPVYTQEDLDHLNMQSESLSEDNQILLDPTAFASNSNDSKTRDTVLDNSYEKGLASPFRKCKDSDKPLLNRNDNLKYSKVEKDDVFSVLDPEYTHEDLKYLNIKSEVLQEQNQVLFETADGASNNNETTINPKEPDSIDSSNKDNNLKFSDYNPKLRYSNEDYVFSVLDPVYSYEDLKNLSMKSDVLQELNQVFTEPIAFASNSDGFKTPDNVWGKPCQKGSISLDASSKNRDKSLFEKEPKLTNSSDSNSNNSKISNNDSAKSFQKGSTFPVCKNRHTKLPGSCVQKDDIYSVLDPVYTKEDLKHLQMKPETLKEQNQVLLEPTAFASSSDSSKIPDDSSSKTFKKGSTAPVCKNKYSSTFPRNDEPFMDNDSKLPGFRVEKDDINSVLDPLYTKEDLKHLQMRPEALIEQNQVLLEPTAFADSSNDSKKSDHFPNNTLKRGSTAPVCKNKDSYNFPQNEKPFWDNNSKGTDSRVNEDDILTVLDPVYTLKDLKHLGLPPDVLKEQNRMLFEHTRDNDVTTLASGSKDSHYSDDSSEKRSSFKRSSEDRYFKKKTYPSFEGGIEETESRFESNFNDDEDNRKLPSIKKHPTAEYFRKMQSQVDEDHVDDDEVPKEKKRKTLTKSIKSHPTAEYFRKMRKNTKESFFEEEAPKNKNTNKRKRSVIDAEDNDPNVSGWKRINDEGDKEFNPDDDRRLDTKKSFFQRRKNHPLEWDWLLDNEKFDETLEEFQKKIKEKASKVYQTITKKERATLKSEKLQEVDEQEEPQHKAKLKALWPKRKPIKSKHTKHIRKPKNHEKRTAEESSSPMKIFNALMSNDKADAEPSNQLESDKTIRKPKKYERRTAEESSSPMKIFNDLMSNDKSDAEPSKKLESDETISAKPKEKHNSFFSKLLEYKPEVKKDKQYDKQPIAESSDELDERRYSKYVARKEMQEEAQRSPEYADEPETRRKSRYLEPEAHEQTHAEDSRESHEEPEHFSIKAKDKSEPEHFSIKAKDKSEQIEHRTNKISLNNAISKGQHKNRLVDYLGNDPYIKNQKILPKHSDSSLKRRRSTPKPFHPPFNPRVRIPHPPFDVRDHEYHTVTFRQPPDLLRKASLPLKRHVVTYHAKQVRAQGVAKLPRPVVKMPQFMMRSSVLAVELGIFATLLARYKGGCK